MRMILDLELPCRREAKAATPVAIYLLEELWQYLWVRVLELVETWSIGQRENNL
jgi:hypothetical protein